MMNDFFKNEPPSVEDLSVQTQDRILVFGINTCPHCILALPFMAQVQQRYGVTVDGIEDGKGRRLGRHFKVKLWPSFILVRAGEALACVVRPQNLTDITTVLDQHLSVLKSE